MKNIVATILVTFFYEIAKGWKQIYEGDEVIRSKLNFLTKLFWVKCGLEFVKMLALIWTGKLVTICHEKINWQRICEMAHQGLLSTKL